MKKECIVEIMNRQSNGKENIFSDLAWQRIHKYCSKQYNG